MVKRIFDIIFSAAGLLVLSPVFFITGIFVKADSKGPVIFRQKRVGKDNLDFSLYKFRTMTLDSDSKGLLTIGGRDSRITGVGYYLRKYKIDELPQLLNVFKGEMSFVGPRPEVRKYVDLYSAEQKEILSVKPGITDVASVKYKNENEILEKQKNPEEYYIKVILPDKIRMNIEYINQRSLYQDLKVIFKTVISIAS